MPVELKCGSCGNLFIHPDENAMDLPVHTIKGTDIRCIGSEDAPVMRRIVLQPAPITSAVPTSV